MSSVDDRIVNMQFNNKQFTQGVQQSQRDLTGLDKTLANAGKSSGLTQMGSAAQAVSTKFSAMQVAGVTAIATIANKVTLAAGSMLKKFTIQPLIDGFKEYTTNLNSIQTIMANTGKGVGEVNKYLAELNKYSDQTIYNFSEMARNIGTFTAAGVELETATSAIKGISNLAALSGSNSQQASTAMYQLSQAIAAGKVGLMDWNSVVNAGMGGKIFKNALAQTAVAMGDLSSEAVKVGTDVTIMGQSFRNSISAAAGQESWLTSDVLIKTLSQLDGRFSKARMAAEGFTKAKEQDILIEKERQKLAKQGIVYSEKEFKAMVKNADAAYQAATTIKSFPQLLQVVQESIGSMWANAFQIVLGDFKQSKKLWSSVGDEIGDIIDGISGKFLGGLRLWEKRGGRDKLLKGMTNIFGSLLKVMTAVKDAFGDIFPKTSVSILFRLTKAFNSFTKNLVPSADTLEDIRTIFGALFSVLHLGITLLIGVGRGLSAFFGALFDSTDGARGGILSIVAAIAEVITKVEKWITSGGRLTSFLEGIGRTAGAALSPIVAAIGLVIDAFGSLISGEGLGGAAKSFERAKDVFTGFIGGIIQGLDELTAPFDGLKEDIGNLAEKMAEPFGSVIDAIERVRIQIVEGLGLDKIQPSLDGLNTLLDKIKSKLVSFAESLRLPSISMEDLGNAADYVVDKFNAMVDGIQNAVEKLDISGKLDKIKAGISGLFEGLTSGGGGGGASGASAMAATADKTGAAFETLGNILAGTWGVLKSIGAGIKSAIGWIVEQLSNIPFPDDALEWASVLNALISGALIKRLFFSKGVFETLKETIESFGTTFKRMGKGVSGAFGQLTDTLKTMQGAIKSEMIKNIAIAVALLVASLVVLSFIPQEKLAAGLAALAAVMLMTGVMMQLMMKSLNKMPVKDLIKYGIGFALIGAGMVLMATSIMILAGAVAVLAFIPFDKLKQGMAAMAIVMGIMIASMLVLSGQSAKVLAVGGAMMLMATAIGILVPAVIALGVIPFDTLKQGLSGLAWGLGIMTAALLVLSGAGPKVLAAGGAMMMMAIALETLVPAIVTLGLLPWDVVQQGLTAVGIGVGIMVLSLLALSGAGPAILAAGGAMMMFAASLNILIPLILTLGLAPWEVVKQGLTGMAIALGILIVAGYAAIGAAPGLAALSYIILAMGAAMFLAGTGMGLFATGLALLAAVGVAAVGVITLAIGAFLALLPNIAIQVAAAFVTFVQAIALAAPKIRKAMGTIIENMIGTVRDAIPELRKLFEDMSNNAALAVQNTVPVWIETAWVILDAFLKSIADHLPSVIESATQIAEALIEGLGNNAVRLANAGADALINVLNGFEDAVRTKGPQIREAMKGLADAMADEFFALTRDIFTSIPMPSLPEWVKNPKSLIPGMRVSSEVIAPGRDFRGGGGKVDPLIKSMTDALTAAGITVAGAIERSVALLVGNAGATGKAGDYARQTDKAQYDAKYAEVRAGYLDTAATKAEEKFDKKREKAQKIKDKKKRAKAMKAIKDDEGKKAQALRTAATRQQKAAEKAQERADAAAKATSEETSFNSSMAAGDFRGAGDVRSQQGQEVADKAASMLAEAKAKEAEANRLAQGNKADKKKAEQLRKEARAAANEANTLALEAIRIQGEASALYERARAAAAAEVRNRMTDLKAAIAKEDADRQWQKDFDALSKEPAKQADMLLKRAEASENTAAAARAEMDRQFAEAERLADTDAEGAMAALDEAERQAAIANSAADSAAADRTQMQQLLDQKKQEETTGTTSSGAQIQPSRTALEDASGAVDRYTTSLQQAEEAAGSGASSPTFVQNNYSPEALPASTIYRQGKNLVSAAGVKMGA